MNRDDKPDAMQGQRVPVKWADRAQYHSAAMPDDTRAPGGGTRPKVTLLNATPDPLGGLAALCGIYEGKVLRRLSEITDDERRAAWEAMRATVLNGPLEAIQFHFLVEGVTRAFTHQAVRNRFSFFAQESLRFAVVDDEPWLDRQAYPPSLAAKPVPSHLADGRTFDFNNPEVVENPDYGPDEHAYALQRDAWNDAILVAQDSYKRLVESGIPAEEARGLMPHAITTRYHWVVNIRALLAESGKRLCTQAQFEWRVVMAEVVKALRDWAETGCYHCGAEDGWQFNLMAAALQPVCYQTGNCGFMARFDRGCTIRERVEANATIGRSSSEWHLSVAPGDEDTSTVGAGVGYGASGRPSKINAIHPKEWLADPAAART